MQDDNPYKNMSDETYVSMKIRSIAQLLVGVIAEAKHPDDIIKMLEFMEANWQEFVPIVKETLWELDKLEMDQSGRLQ